MARRGTRSIKRRRMARTEVAASARRMAIGRLLLILALVVTGGRLVQLQGFEANALSKASEQQRITRDRIPAERGSIVDRRGNVLAFSSEARQLYTNPRSLGTEQDKAHAEDPAEPTGEEYKRQIARYIDQVLGDRITEQEVRDALFKDAKFTYFGPVIDPGKARLITEKFYPHIGAEYRAVREYPAGAVGANLIGAANWRMDQRKVRGLVGLENSLDTTLAGRDGEKIADTARGSDVVIPGSERELRPATPGSDVALTVDSDLQFTVQQKLRDYVAKAGAKSGSAVMLDSKTGEVFSLANSKSFEPVNPDTWGGGALGNPAVSSPYEPGSVNKVITAAGAIEHGIVKPDTVLQVPGSIKVADSEIGDAWNHGKLSLTFTGVLGKSSNVGTLMTAQKLGEDRFNELVHKFGIGHKTGIELPGESSGSVPPREEWSGTTFANLPIGQGLSMTTLQMTGMLQAIANNGVRVPPRVIDFEIRPDGTRVERPQPAGVRVVSPHTANTVKNMLRAVVQDEPGQRGTGPKAALEGYQIAGKTGTAQQPDPKCGCYSQSKYWITFAGIVPADDPRFVVGLMLDAPTGGTPEAKSAAPLFHDIAAYLTQRYQIPLTRSPAPKQILQLPR